MKKRLFSNLELIVYGTILLILLCSLFFGKQLEYFLKLKPDLHKICDNSLSVHFVDVGQGDAILIRYPNNKTLLVDSGPIEAKNNLLNYIDNIFFNNVDKKVFDYVMLTHPDSDHCGNMLTILDKYKVKNFIRPTILVNGLEDNEEFIYKTDNKNYADIIISLATKNINTIFAKADLKIKDDEINYMHILSPIKLKYNNDNSFSPIMKIEHNNVKFMLTGDATQENEREVINSYSQEIIDCDILKLGHHGSNTSTSSEFLNAITPNAIVVSAGKNNRYLHPDKQVIDRIVQYGENNNINIVSNIFSTQNQGNIIFSVSGNNTYNKFNILNVNNYLFLDYYIIVNILILIFVVDIVLPKFYKPKRLGQI